MDREREGLIDVHHHHIPPFYLEENLDRIAASWGGRLSATWHGWSPQRAIEAMDRAGIETSVLSLSSPGVWFGDAAQARTLARRVNEYASRMRAEHPGRFGLFAAIPLPDVEGSLREIAHALDVLGADGVGLLTSYEGRWLGHASYRPVFEELDRRKAVVFVHPTVPRCCRALMPEVRPVVTEIPQDTCRAIASLLYTGTLSRYGGIRFIFAHAGGAMPMAYGRLIQFRPAGLDPEGIDRELRRLYYDIAATAYRPAVAALRALVPASQILLGTDCPYAPAELTTAGMAALGLRDDELRALGRENARALLPRLRRTRAAARQGRLLPSTP